MAILFRLSMVFLLAIPMVVFSHNNREHSRNLIPLPDGFQPEGVARLGHSVFVGSLNSGAIVSVDLLSGKGKYLVEGGDGQAAVGLAVDKRSGFLYVAGGPFGTIKVYDTRDGKQQAEFQLTQPFGFVNDGIVSKDAAYFTDSFLGQIYRLPLSKKGEIFRDTDIEVIPLSGDFQLHEGEFNANGIVFKDDALLVVNSFSGLLYRVEPDSGHATRVDLVSGELKNGDGMWLKDDKLYVAQNFFNQIAVVELEGGAAEITSVIKSPLLRIPTTLTAFGNTLYVVNARFDVAPPPFFGNPPADPGTEFELVGVRINQDED